ncbi:hypothetical protein Rhopal_002319-T1 [Rhodotorula paludigena]|uniref:Guanine nucleotide exchange factor Vps9 n=1 Tax=Rhodotorula paludigena TaxID=86838 RepID=A0AAV5GHH9_9BASI|nr:hypothetical protein Rhopal_002319-T1 [Rhodotorula paludigena]
MSAEASKDAPELPPFPDLSPLAASFDHQPPAPPLEGPALDDSPSGIWATVPSTSTASVPSAPTQTVSASGYHAAYSVPAPAPPPSLDDLDPFAPTAGTLGGTMRRESRLELLESSESEEGGSPTDGRRFRDEQEQHVGRGPPPASQTGGGFSFGNMLRSISGTPTKEHRDQQQRPPVPTLPPPPAGAVESALPGQPTTPPATSSSTPLGAPQTPSGPSTLAKPLASIASVFRSTTGKSSAASSAASSPQPGSSPSRDKGSFMTAIVGTGAGAAGKGKEKAPPPAATDEQQSVHDEKAESQGPRREPVFDFNKFLEQMRSRSADPIAKYLRSFLKEFSRRPPVSTSDQVRVINDFLDFIAGKMRTVDPWKSLLAVDWRDDPEQAEAEVDLALEAMEKLVMNRLWHFTFTPALDLSAFPGHMSPSGDVERDDVLKQRIRLFSWIEPKHLDLPIPSPPADALTSDSEHATEKTSDQQRDPEKQGAEEAGGEASHPTAQEEKAELRRREKIQGFLDFAQRELCKMNQYKAPRDKLICVLNCCKVIFGLIRHVGSGEEGADAFIPFLIYVVIKANPQHLVSNLQYIQRFRNPEKLSGEGGYYLSSLNAAISFIESVDASALSNITQEEFEVKVAAAVKQLASEEPPPPVPPRDPAPSSRPTSPASRPPPSNPAATSADLIQPSEAASASLLAAGGEGGVRPATPQDLTFPETMKQSFLRGTDSVERAMSKPLGALARIFEQLEETAAEFRGDAAQQHQQQQLLPHVPPAPLPPTPGAPAHSARPGVSKRRSYHASLHGPPAPGSGGGYPGQHRPGLPPLPPSSGSLQHGVPEPDPALYAPADETDEAVLAEIDRQHEEARMAALETLRGVFPNVEDEVLEMVLLSNSGDMGKTIDSLLEMT